MSDDEAEYSEDEAEDLTQLVEVLRRMRTENLDLKRNFESLKELHLQLSTSHKQLQAKHAALYDERVNVERQYQALCESWRVELEEKQKLFEQARAQVLAPRDLELIKVRLLEEVEGPYKAKCELLAREAESSQANFLRLRREHEELQAAFKSLELRTLSEQEALRADHTAQVNTLKDKVASLSGPAARATTLETTLKAKERERSELQFAIAKLQDENDDLRRQKERVAVEKDAVALKVERKVKAIQAEEMELSSLVESLTRKNRHLSKELGEAQRASEESFAQLMKAQGEKATLQSQMDALRKQFALEKQAVAEQYEDSVRKLEERVTALRDELHERERQVAELHIAHQEQASRLVEAHDLRLQEVEREGAERLREARDQRSELTAKVEALKDACEDYKRECEDFQRKMAQQAAAAQRDAERMQAALSESERQSAGQAMELAELRSELERTKAELSRLELNHGSLSRRKDELDAQVERLHEEAREAAAVREGLAKDLDQAKRALEGERAAHVNHMDSSRQAFAVEKAALAKRYQAALRELQARHEEELKRSRRRLKHSAADVAALTDEVAELKFKSHELEAAAAAAGAPPAPMLLGLGVPFSGAAAQYSAPAGYSMGFARTPSISTADVMAVRDKNNAGGISSNSHFLAAQPQQPVASAAATASPFGPGMGSYMTPRASGALGSTAAGFKTGGAGGSSSGISALAGSISAVNAALLSDLAALRQRQQEYLDAAGVKPVS